jgi:hypothetical protein
MPAINLVTLLLSLLFRLVDRMEPEPSLSPDGSNSDERRRCRQEGEVVGSTADTVVNERLIIRCGAPVNIDDVVPAKDKRR